jgi:ABC-2 type transport system permease protein
MNLGLSILSKEARERTADFLLVKPVSRSAIISAKLMAAFTAIVATNIVFNTLTLLMASLTNTDFSVIKFLMINLSMFFIQIIFVAIGMVISVFFKKMKTVLPISLGIVFGFYFIGAFLVTDSGNKVERILSPFKYFDVIYIINNASYEVFYLIVGVAVVVVYIVASYIIYNKKDIHAVS